MKTVQLFDTVTNIKPIIQERLTLVEPNYQSIQSLPSGQVGTVVEIYTEVNPFQYLVEFADTQGREYAMAILNTDEILVLHYELTIA
ncbi:MAG: DUF4926 domain-containing protein [Limnoraphis sp. WC205]|jgi:hypothetical protein|nr:DUF4926 domain-containing protein [Limnoraphis sp. WC205]